LGGIPQLACDRNEDHPLVIGEGRPRSIRKPLADFFDLFLVATEKRLFRKS